MVIVIIPALTKYEKHSLRSILLAFLTISETEAIVYLQFLLHNMCERDLKINTDKILSLNDE